MRSISSPLYRAVLELLVEARRRAKITQTQLAERLERPQSFVSKAESGERRLDVAEFLLITRAIGADPHDILRRAEEVAGHAEERESSGKDR